jgi:5-formyltetrahydrofolate cyclo-ligase
VAIPSNSPEKAAQRTIARDVLKDLDWGMTPIWSGAICAFLSAWLEEHVAAHRVAVFAALPGEPELAQLHTLRPEREYLYPLVLPGNDLSFHLVSDPRTLRKGRFGIREPDPQVHPPVLESDLDTVLCPGLAFAADGTRLGRGKGFYDRALAKLAPGTPRIGVGFAVQWAPRLPAEPHDQRMSHLVNEHGIHLPTRPTEGSA